MRYFSLSEVLLAIPTSVLLGAVFALVHTLLLSVASGAFTFIRLSKRKMAKNIKKRSFSAAEKKTKRNDGMIHFIITEVINCLFLIALTPLFLIYLYIISDGIPRAYIIIITVLSFFAVSVLFRKPLDLICTVLSFCVFKVIRFSVRLITYLPHKIYKRIRHRKIKAKTKEKRT